MKNKYTIEKILEFLTLSKLYTNKQAFLILYFFLDKLSEVKHFIIISKYNIQPYYYPL